jgi:multidrug efflux system membrane fusion protein
MKLKPSYVIAVAVAVAAAGWLLSGQFERTDATAAPADAPSTSAESVLARVRVRDQTAEQRRIEIKLSGRTAANRLVEVSAQTRGTVAEILVEKGAAVSAGDVLLRLNTDDRDARLRQAKALLTQREIEYRAAVKLADKGFRSETAAAEAQAALQEAKAAVMAMEIDMGFTAIAAPFAGLVDQRPAEIGKFVDIGDPVATVVDLDPILVVGEVSERDIGSVAVGALGTAELVTGERVAGKVRFISAVANEKTRTFRVELEVPNPDGRIAQGISSEIRLPVAQAPAHLVSPAILTLADNGDIGVKIVGPGDVVEFRPVTIVADGPEGVWIGGLPESVTIITVGQEFIAVGQKVEPVRETALPAS